MIGIRNPYQTTLSYLLHELNAQDTQDMTEDVSHAIFYHNTGDIELMVNNLEKYLETIAPGPDTYLIVSNRQACTPIGIYRYVDFALKENTIYFEMAFDLAVAVVPKGEELECYAFRKKS